MGGWHSGACVIARAINEFVVLHRFLLNPTLFNLWGTSPKMNANKCAFPNDKNNVHIKPDMHDSNCNMCNTLHHFLHSFSYRNALFLHHAPIFITAMEINMSNVNTACIACKQLNFCGGQCKNSLGSTIKTLLSSANHFYDVENRFSGMLEIIYFLRHLITFLASLFLFARHAPHLMFGTRVLLKQWLFYANGLAEHRQKQFLFSRLMRF